MAVRFFNSRSRRIEVFDPIEPGKVRMYSCGPTVYNYAHIGNLRAFVFCDLLKRYLRYRSYDVLHVMNITDVDDKTIRGSVASGKALAEYTDFYLAEFLKDFATLSIQEPDVMPRATAEIAGMIEMIQTLIEKGHAYITTSGDVYFKVTSCKDYGDLVGLDSSQLKSNADGRLNADDEYDKENAQDFALWKAYVPEDGDVYWDSPFGKGRPGWHIECSVMSIKYLGQPFDIHTGGIDLKFPHHTNEIAQSECASGREFVRYWLHNEHLLVDGKKMSKSLGNFYTLRDLLEKGYDPRAIRFELIKTHYRQQLDFREDHIAQNLRIIERFEDLYARLSSTDESIPAESSQAWNTTLEKYSTDFQTAMDSDLNVSEGLAVIYEFVKTLNKEFAKLNSTQRQTALKLFRDFNSVFGFISEEVTVSHKGVLEAEIQGLIDERELARKSKNFARADEIRDQLLQSGIELKDTPEGVQWKRK